METDDIADGTFDEQRQRVDRPMGRLFGEYAVNHLGMLLFGAGSGIFAHIIRVLPPYLLGVAIDSIFRNEKAFDLALVPATYLPARPFGQFLLVSIIVALSYLISSLLGWARGYGLNVFAQRLQHDLRTDTYDAMQALNMGFFADRQTGELMSILNNDVNRLEQFLNGGINITLRITFTILSTVAVLLLLNWQLALVVMSIIPLMMVMTHLFVRTIQPKYADVRSAVGQLNSQLENNLGGMSLIKASNTEPYESDRVQESSRDYYDTNLDALKTRVLFFPGLKLVSGIGFTLTFIIGGYWVLSGPPLFFSGPLTVGTFVTFIFLARRFVWPLMQFGQLINLLQRAYASAERVFGLMDQPNPLRDGGQALALTSGRVDYEGVSFGYDDETVLHDLSFTIEGGATTALVGPTGAGKSTTMKVLMRLYDVDKGAIRIDGQDLRDVTVRTLRSVIGYVGQETFLFYGTVRDNIAYGAFEADEEALRTAAHRARAHEFIDELPDGYDTEVGERGVKLSGGQRQRIAIARALLQDPQILLLDEATSDVDTATEKAIQSGIEQLIADRTVMAIAHRLSTIRDADQILVLKGGRIIERGTHDELLDEEGLYADLYDVQANRIDDQGGYS